MGGTTPAPWSIPYPTGTDRVADGDNAIQALAERLNYLGFNPPMTLAYTSHALNAGWGGSIVVGKLSGWVHVWFSLIKVSWVSNEYFAPNLPAGCRPAYGIYFQAMEVNEGKPVPVQVATNGATLPVIGSAGISPGAGGGISGHVSYPGF